MKKLTLFIITIFTVATLYAAARPSLDGRAVVADSGTMPRGLFARTVGYLPGDSVTVTNPASGSTIDVLVLGAIDPSEGVAILLSPEAADGLRIKPNSNVQVKLTKRAGSLDENANGSAVLSDAEEEEEAPENKALAEESEEENESPALASNEPEDKEEYTEYPAIAEDDSGEDEKDYEETPVVAEKPKTEEKTLPAETEPVEESPAIAEKEEAVEERPVLLKDNAVAEKTAKEEAEPETVYEELPPLPQNEKLQKVVVIEEEAASSEESVEEKLVEEKVQPETVKEEIAEEKVEADKIAEEKAAEEKAYEEAVSEEKIAFEEAPVTKKEEKLVQEQLPPVVEELPVDSYEQQVIIKEVPSSEENSPYVIESEPEVLAENTAEEEADAFGPIVLVPADANPPAAEEKYEPVSESLPASEKVTESSESLAVKTEAAEEKIEKEPKAEAVAVEDKTAPKPLVTNRWTNYVVPSSNNLRRGYYYVQVASLGNTDNIKAFVDKYSTKYPVVLVQNSSKNAYQVMVGPLNIDEYGSVGEKFKAYGFKDSFVRKIK